MVTREELAWEVKSPTLIRNTVLSDYTNRICAILQVKLTHQNRIKTLCQIQASESAQQSLRPLSQVLHAVASNHPNPGPKRLERPPSKHKRQPGRLRHCLKSPTSGIHEGQTV